MTKIKICGLQTLEDVYAVNRVSPDYVGFVFAPSKRQVTDQQAKCLRKQLSKDILSVGVFVNDSIAYITSLCNSHVIDLVQLHGEESDEYIRVLQSNVSVPVIKAVRLSSMKTGKELLGSPADYLLYDAFAGKNIYGGSGKLLDTSLLPRLIRPTFLAGGLNVENVEQIVKEHEPFCVDVSSSVETDGRKDYLKMRQFTQKVRNIGGSMT